RTLANERPALRLSLTGRRTMTGHGLHGRPGPDAGQRGPRRADLRRGLRPLPRWDLLDLPARRARALRIPALPSRGAAGAVPVDGRAHLHGGHAADPARRSYPRWRRRDSGDPPPASGLALAGRRVPPARPRGAGARPLPLGGPAPLPDFVH